MDKLEIQNNKKPGIFNFLKTEVFWIIFFGIISALLAVFVGRSLADREIVGTNKIEVVAGRLVGSNEYKFKAYSKLEAYAIEAAWAVIFGLLGAALPFCFFTRNKNVKLTERVEGFFLTIDNKIGDKIKSVLNEDIERSQNIKRYENIEKQLTNVDKRLTNMVEKVAFYTQDNVLEKKGIELLRNKRGGVMWISAKFISQKLSVNFQSLKFDIDGDEYSEFSSKLYPECLESIHLTMPFTPAEWFRQLYGTKTDEIIQSILYNSTRPLNYVPPMHIQSLIKSNVKDKKRLVILPSEDSWISLIAQEKLLDEFIKLNGSSENIITHFTDKDRLLELHYDFADDQEYDFSRFDYAIFDHSIALKWERPSKPEQGHPIELIDLDNTETKGRDVYTAIKSKLFEEKKEFNKFLSVAEVKSYIRSQVNKLKSGIIANNKLPHKYAYFVEGSQAWCKICKDQENYLLGELELKTLKSFLHDCRNEISTTKKYNIIHIGIGDGKEIPDIVNGIGLEHIAEYHLIDISPELLYSAEINIKKCEKTRFISHVLDIIEVKEEKLSAIGNNNLPRLFVIVANGGILSNKPVLKNLQKIMGSSDKLLITLETYVIETHQEILNQFVCDSVINLLIQPLKLIGIQTQDLKSFLRPDYDKKDGCVKVLFQMKNWVEKHPEMENNFNDFPPEFEIFSTLRLPIGDLEKHIIENGFKRIKFQDYTYIEKGKKYVYFGALCEKN
jgi:hypothetical protein